MTIHHIGSDGDDTMGGMSLGEYFYDNGGDDVIYGGTGADTLYGGTDNDIYIVDSLGDVVIEKAGEGHDKVEASVSYTLSDHVEELVLTGTVISGTGNSLGNVIYGNDAGNVLDGAGGNDSLIGGLGDDTLVGGADDDNYRVDGLGDMVEACLPARPGGRGA